MAAAVEEKEYEAGYVLSKMADMVRPKVPVVRYVPRYRDAAVQSFPMESSWAGIDTVLGEIIDRFALKTDSCLEFGVEYGYSTTAFARHFKSVTGVDTFQGDRHTQNLGDHFAETSARLAPRSNIHLVQSDYQTFTRDNHDSYDLIHVDIIHTYADTYACGLWSAEHSSCTLFHDTESFRQVKQAVADIARKTGKTFYNFEEFHGLGILV